MFLLVGNNDPGEGGVSGGVVLKVFVAYNFCYLVTWPFRRIGLSAKSGEATVK